MRNKVFIVGFFNSFWFFSVIRIPWEQMHPWLWVVPASAMVLYVQIFLWTGVLKINNKLR